MKKRDTPHSTQIPISVAGAMLVHNQGGVGGVSADLSIVRGNLCPTPTVSGVMIMRHVLRHKLRAQFASLLRVDHFTTWVLSEFAVKIYWRWQSVQDIVTCRGFFSTPLSRLLPTSSSYAGPATT
jgi:hypothetical protein